MDQKKLKLGVVGCGWAGQQAVLAAVAGPGTEVAAISDLEVQLRCQTAKEYGVPHVYGDYADLLADDGVEAVYLAVNPVMRYPMVLDAIAAKKHVLVQKPHGVRAAEILAFEAAAKGAGVVLQFCYFMRHYPKNRGIKAAVEQGRIGAPYHGRVFLKYNDKPAAEGITRWLQVYGNKGGALGQHASHELNLAWWWMGCPKPEWAFAQKHVLNPAYEGPEGPAEDYFSGLLGLEGGKTLQIDCSRWLHCNTPTTVEVYGREGAISAGELSYFRAGEFVREAAPLPPLGPYSTAPEPSPCFYHEIEHFALAVRGVVKPEVDAQNAYQFMKILDGLYDSAQQGQRVSIE